MIEDYLNQAELNIAEEFANKFNEKIKGGKYIKQKDNSFKFQKDEVK